MMKYLSCITVLFLSFTFTPGHTAARQSEPNMSNLAVSGEEYVRLQEEIAAKVHESGIPPGSCGPSKAATATATSSSSSSSSSCSKYYDRIASDGVFSIGLGIGYLSPISDGQTATGRYMTVIDNLTRPCCPKGAKAETCELGNKKKYQPASSPFACGFTRKDETISVALSDGKKINGKYTVLVKETTIPTSSGPKKVLTKVPLCLPHSPSKDPKVSFAQSATCDALFSQSIKYDDVTTYLGHDYGNGPEFFPHSYVADTMGAKNAGRFFSADSLAPHKDSKRPRPAHKQVYMLGCNTVRHAESLKKAKGAAGYTDDNFDYIYTRQRISTEGTQIVRLIDSLGSGACTEQLSLATRGFKKEPSFNAEGSMAEMPEYDSRFDPSRSDGVDDLGSILKLDTSELFNSSH